MDLPVTILALTWNSQGVRMCESLNRDEIQQHRSGLLTTWRYDCETFDIFSQLAEQINQKQPTLVVIAFQEYTGPGNYAHSYLFPNEMPKLGYKEVGHKGLQYVSQVPRSGNQGLKTLVYLRSEFEGQITPALGPSKRSFRDYRSTLVPTQVRGDFPKYLTNFELGPEYPNGGLAVYLKLSNGQTLAIMNVYLPFDATNMDQTYQLRDSRNRLPSTDLTTSIFNDIYDHLITKSQVYVDHVIALGDLNFRMAPYSDWSPITVGATLLELQGSPEFSTEVQQQDELYRNLHRLPKFEEGVTVFRENGRTSQGPQFRPTCELIPGRTNSNDLRDYQLKNRTPSFCDRILYQSRPLAGTGPSPVLTSLEYGSIDQGITTKSTHAAVYGQLGFVFSS